MPGDISEVEKSGLLKEFNNGITGLKTVFTLKLTHWSQEGPWTIYRTTVTRRVIVEDALRALLASTSSHGRVKEFQQEPVHSQAK